MRTTINDVARLAGVSKATVSYVLNGDTSHVSEETATRVFKAMEELNYRPNAVARSLVRRRTHVIGIVVARIDRSPYPEAVRGISETVRQKGYNVLLISSEGKLELEKESLNLLYEQLADGMVIVSASGKGGNSHLLDLVRSKVPLAVINRFENDVEEVHAIHIDNASGMYAATRHLIALGHQAIGCIHAPVDGPQASRAAIERMNGFRKAMDDEGLPVNERWMREGPLDRVISWEASIAIAKQLFSEKPRPTALVCTNDYMAMGVLRAAHEEGIRVPEDLALIGHDNTTASAFCTPQLTTVEQPMYKAGVEAAKAVLNTLAAKSLPVTVALPCELIVRESCGVGKS